MKKLTYLSISVLAAFAASCDGQLTQITENEPDSNLTKELTQEEIRALSYSFNDTRVTEQEATRQAESIMRFLDSSTPTKSAAGRSISSIKPITKQSAKTKSGTETDTLAYLFNFSNEQGYTILSADRRTDYILSLVPQGNIDFDEDISEDILQTGVMVFYGNLYAAYEKQIERANKLQDSLIESALAKLEADGTITRAGTTQLTFEYGIPEYKVAIPKMIPVRWGQDNPYDLSTPIQSGQHCKTGCVATAVAQLMAYWRYPSSYNWNVMMPASGNESLATYQNISQLMYNVGVGVNTKYGVNSSSAYFDDIPGYLSQLGYNSGNYGAYNQNKVENSLKNHRPVLIAGSSLKVDVYTKYLIFWKKYSHTYYDGNHTWLLDGLMNVTTPVVLYNNGKYMQTIWVYDTMVHCNFGWPELAIDGYYDWGAFNINNGPVTRSQSVYGENGNYQFNVECITEIYK